MLHTWTSSVEIASELLWTVVHIFANRIENSFTVCIPTVHNITCISNVLQHLSCNFIVAIHFAMAAALKTEKTENRMNRMFENRFAGSKRTHFLELFNRKRVHRLMFCGLWDTGYKLELYVHKSIMFSLWLWPSWDKNAETLTGRPISKIFLPSTS